VEFGMQRVLSVSFDIVVVIRGGLDIISKINEKETKN